MTMPDGLPSTLDGRLFIGLMSGTSMDGVDGVLARFLTGHAPQVLAHASLPMPHALGKELLALNRSGPDELQRAALAANALVHVYAQVVKQLLAQQRCQAESVTAIGAHGQTVRHRPDLGFTVQLNAPALLAELTRIDVIADFRSRDIAAGGQGAPLVPTFHAAMFDAPHPRAVLNLGGIANVTLLSPGAPPRGFDTGPANVLLDAWCLRHTGKPYDADGHWAAGGKIIPALLAHLIASEPWFILPVPKSTGRDLFNMAWLEQRLADFGGQDLAPQDVQATLQHLTARTVANAIDAAAPGTQDVLVCGGGAHNSALMRDLAYCLQRPLAPTDSVGVPAQQVEAIAFAWLAQAHLDRRPAGLPEVTGARGARVLGARYPA